MNKLFTNAEWSKHAQTYEQGIGALTASWASDSVRVAHPKIKQLLSQSQGRTFEMLDVGCGPGKLAFELAIKYCSSQLEATPIHITATDVADGMLNQLNIRLQEDEMLQPFASSISTVQMDGRELDKVADASVDVVGSNFGLSIFPHRERGWQSAHRVLRGGGVLFATAWDYQSANVVWGDRLANMYNTVVPNLETGPRPLVSEAAATDENRIAEELKAAGFRNVKAVKTTHTIVEDFDTVVSAVVGNPTFLDSQLREQAKATVASILQQLAASKVTSERDAAPEVAVFDMIAYTFVASK